MNSKVSYLMLALFQGSTLPPNAILWWRRMLSSINEVLAPDKQIAYLACSSVKL